MYKKEAIKIKLFKTLLILIPCLILAVLVIVALPKKEKVVIDIEGDLDAFDEPTFVTNSDMSFFYKKDQLSTYREQRRAEKATYFKMSENIVTTDFTKNEISMLPDLSQVYSGSHSMVYYDGQPVEYTAVTNTGYILKSGQEVSFENAFEIFLNDGIFGSSVNIPHKIERGKTYYAAFTCQPESIYFEINSDNEFVSIQLGGLSGRVEYTLLDSAMNPIKNGWNNSNETLEVQYKGRGAAKYYLKLTGYYQDELKPFYVKLPFDNNEWQWQMVYSDLNAINSGTFDYYGDEDYFLLPPSVTENMNKSVLCFTKADFDINVVIYDKNRNVIGQYVYIPGQTDVISMYGLENAYAVSLYSYNGDSSGSQYSFVLEHTEISVLDIETYGFSLSPEFSEDNDYYTAVVSSLSEKKITDVMYSAKDADISITVTQQSGLVSTAALGENLNLAPGRNTVVLKIQSNGIMHEIVIVISDKTYDLSYGYIINSAVKVYENATTGSSVIATLSRSTKVLILNENIDSGFVHIQLCSGDKIGSYGYVRKNDIFAGYEQTVMPESYASYINALKQQHPNWKFTFVKTGYDFNSYVASQLGASSVLGNRQATLDEIKYYVDPRNFLNEQSIFMFEKQTYDESVYSRQGVLSIWNDQTFADYILDGAASTGLSPYFITARAALESGRGTSALATGTIPGYEGYYNFYGIGAIDTNPSNGAVYAKNYNWNSKRKAIIEGAAWVKSQYISCQQYSIYFMKFSFVPNRTWHQYMTDIAAPYKDAQNYYKAHKAGGTLDNEIEFVIPVFENMP